MWLHRRHPHMDSQKFNSHKDIIEQLNSEFSGEFAFVWDMNFWNVLNSCVCLNMIMVGEANNSQDQPN